MIITKVIIIYNYNFFIIFRSHEDPGNVSYAEIGGLGEQVTPVFFVFAKSIYTDLHPVL
jgi:hypothetical protein